MRKENPSGAEEFEDREETIPEHLQCKPYWTSEPYLSATEGRPGPEPEGHFCASTPGSVQLSSGDLQQARRTVVV